MIEQMMRCPKAKECPSKSIGCKHLDKHEKRYDCEDLCTIGDASNCVPVPETDKPEYMEGK